jgi:RHH-type proline utilization regulon transcriptional repressor/proline dehydrogenase/delta 1-pyrroline-5-carboxylate dehydrogenase
LPPQVKAKVVLHDLTLPNAISVDAALLHADAAAALRTQAWLAKRAGAIVTLTVMPPGESAVPLARLVSERSISSNTAAAGGNASLMTLAV